MYKRQPKKITKVADIQLSVSAQNLFTLTKYTGMDPEVYSESDYGFNGVDMGSYPDVYKRQVSTCVKDAKRCVALPVLPPFCVHQAQC